MLSSASAATTSSVTKSHTGVLAFGRIDELPGLLGVHELFLRIDLRVDGRLGDPAAQRDLAFVARFDELERGPQRGELLVAGVASGRVPSGDRGHAAFSGGMVKAADSLKGKLADLSTGGVQVHLTGASGMWSDFNAANRSAMLKSEVISWPVTLGDPAARVRLARRRRAAADADDDRARRRPPACCTSARC